LIFIESWVDNLACKVDVESRVADPMDCEQTGVIYRKVKEDGITYLSKHVLATNSTTHRLSK